jgi:hypothetical protein
MRPLHRTRRAGAALLLAGGVAALALSPTSSAAPAAGPAFDTPVLSGIQGYGFEQSMRLADDGTVYASVPNSLSSLTSFVWRSLDDGRTFKWVPAAAPLNGKLPTCVGGGDTELAVDTDGSLYFIDLTLANFSVGRSDDKGQTFVGDCTAVTSALVDRQWYASRGDPKAGGSLYLASNEVAQGVPNAQCLENNQLVMYRSPAHAAAGATAGLAFAPAKDISASCDEGIMGNNEISPTTGHIFIPHDNNAFNAILVARCEDVPFTTDPSGLSCTDVPVTSFPESITAALFPTLAIDRVGTLYVSWQQATVTGTYDEATDTDDRIVSGDTLLYLSKSTDDGLTWSAPMQIPTPGLHHNVYNWVVGGDAGRIGMAWYGTTDTSEPGTAPDGNTQQPQDVSGPDTVDGVWNLYYSITTDGGTTWTTPVVASDHPVRKGPLFTFLGGGNQGGGRRSLGDFINLRMGPQGEALISYGDGTNIIGEILPHAMFARQNGGPGLLASPSTVTGPPRLVNGATDPADDATFDALGVVSPVLPNLDLLSSSFAVLDADNYRVTMTVADLSDLAPSPQAGGTTLVWSTQWKTIAFGAPNGGKTFHVYMESVNGGEPTFHLGENALTFNGGGALLTYPGNVEVPGEYNPDSGVITIDVPKSAVALEGADPTLYSVTSSTHSLPEAADTVPSLSGIGGVQFNLVDVVAPYSFGAPVVVPAPSTSSAAPTAAPSPTHTTTPRPPLPSTGSSGRPLVVAAMCLAGAALLSRGRRPAPASGHVRLR